MALQKHQQSTKVMQKWIEHRTKIEPKAIPNRSRSGLWGVLKGFGRVSGVFRWAGLFLGDVGPKMFPTWPQLGSQNGASMG